MKAGVAVEAEAMRWLRCLLEVEVGEVGLRMPLNCLLEAEGEGAEWLRHLTHSGVEEAEAKWQKRSNLNQEGGGVGVVEGWPNLHPLLPREVEAEVGGLEWPSLPLERKAETEGEGG